VRRLLGRGRGRGRRRPVGSSPLPVFTIPSPFLRRLLTLLVRLCWSGMPVGSPLRSWSRSSSSSLSALSARSPALFSPSRAHSRSHVQVFGWTLDGSECCAWPHCVLACRRCRLRSGPTWFVCGPSLALWAHFRRF
jgi:hypothetical protein